MLIRIGSKGDNVKKIQEKLFADGIFGKSTQNAVKLWQKKHGLTADGIIGKDSWNKMFSDPIKSNLIKLGSKGEDVKKIQERLFADGIFGKSTQNAVKSWQEKKGLAADGIIGKNSWAKMFPDSVENNKIKVEIRKETSDKLDLSKLESLISSSVLKELPDVINKFQINSPLRLCHFLAQCRHESSSFKHKEENLNYSVTGLKKVFCKYFPEDLANSYAKKPEKIASRVYASRMGNGDEKSKDGFKFRGRGFIQLTGKNNYSAFSKFVGEDLTKNPELVEKKYPLASAAWFFHENGLNKIADKGSSKNDVTKVTKRVNGGTHGLDERIKYFEEYFSCF
jgi:putative chitinase